VNAGKIAGTGYIPSDDRLFVFGKLKKMAWKIFSFTSIPEQI
jgi:hypothetical protein